MVIRLLLLVLFIFSVSCGEDDAATELDEMAQQMGDTMASIDESGGTNNGTFAYRSARGKVFASLNKPSLIEQVKTAFVPEAQAASCFLTNTFGSCTDNVITRDFQDCTILGATFSGTIDLTFDDGTVDNTCTFSNEDDSVTRQPDFSMTGRRGASLAVTSTGTIGQRLTRTATIDEYLFSNDGIRRVFTDTAGDTVLDFTNLTTSDITITGTSRNGRVMDGGALQVTNNVTGQVCSYSPSDVTWTNDCNCATSGSWEGTCDGGATTATVEITGCGTGSISVGVESADVTFDRCFSL